MNDFPAPAKGNPNAGPKFSSPDSFKYTEPGKGDMGKKNFSKPTPDQKTFKKS